jgi:methylenetetrahydrofolate dehydrogenase (NADP+)/methenyltetrahydrofolate cyclohydrolase
VSAKIISGNVVAKSIRSECAARIAALGRRTGIVPGLAVVLVGDSAPSRVYVRNKLRAAKEVGIIPQLFEFGRDVAPETVLSKIDELNADPRIHGILVQLPLPPQFGIFEVLHRISRDKDVDGFHLYNVGGLVVGDTIFPPCTPFGVMKLLEYENIAIEGQNVVIVGASNIVGKPMALMMMQAGATVAVCHVKTRDLAQFTILADILVVAAGVPGLILPQMVKTGCVVVDVGINRLADGRIVGDVHFDGGVEEGVLYHAGTGRRRPDDGDDAALQHDHSRRKERDSAALTPAPCGYRSFRPAAVPGILAGGWCVRSLDGL